MIDGDGTDIAADQNSYNNEDGVAGTSDEAAFTLATATGVSAIYKGDNSDDVAVDTTETIGTAGTDAHSWETFLSLMQMVWPLVT